MSPPRLTGLGVWLVWVLGACGRGSTDGAPASDGGAEAAGMALGSQPPRAVFSVLSEGSAVDLVHGPQGGYHVWLSFHARGVVLTAADDGLVMRYRMVSGLDTLAEGRAYVPWEGVAGDVVTASGLRMYVVVPGSPPPLDGTMVDVDATLEAEDGRVLGRAETRWTVRCCAEE